MGHRNSEVSGFSDGLAVLRNTWPCSLALLKEKDSMMDSSKTKHTATGMHPAGSSLLP